MCEDNLAVLSANHYIDVRDAERMLTSPIAAHESLFSAAAVLRDAGLEAAGRSRTITYSRKVFIPLTTLCRDRCHYCVFVDTPTQLAKAHRPAYMTAEQVLSIARQGAQQGCKEALLTLGDRPEDRWPQARAWLDVHGFNSTIDYVTEMARLITLETGMLAHANPGVMRADELKRLRRVAPSMGMMLETTSRELFERKGSVHFGSPDKDPAVRLKVIEEAGELEIPFTTGILVGIGETARDRAESLIAIRSLQERYGHIQEVIIQNFRAKPHTAMRDAPDAATLDYLATIAVARLIMGPAMRIQAPPNLADPHELDLLISAGVDDWGGVSPVTADHVNPERPWPHLDDLASETGRAGFTLQERLTAQPEYVRDRRRWIDPGLHSAVTSLADSRTGLAQRTGNGGVVIPSGHSPIPAVPPPQLPSARATGHAHDASRAERRLIERAGSEPVSLDDDEWAQLLRVSGTNLDALTDVADAARRYTVGDAISLVVNRNLASSGLRTKSTGGGETYQLSDVSTIVDDAWSMGATELCVQGMLPPEEDSAGYAAIARTVKNAQSDLHLHAFRPSDIADLANRGGLGIEGALSAMQEAGVQSTPGTGVKILDEKVRMQSAPEDIPISLWIEIMCAAHQLGMPSSSVIVYGHHESAANRIAHLRTLEDMQRRARAAGHRGFTELVPIPLPGGQGKLNPDRSRIDEHRAMFAVARLLLVGSIAHIQVPWPKLEIGEVTQLLRAGADDLGGTLLNGNVMPRAGAESGRELAFGRATGIRRTGNGPAPTEGEQRVVRRH
jgi:7,8-didemethyl-8-hydroxy-5-deazariboflavin synthase CofG subunit